MIRHVRIYEQESKILAPYERLTVQHFLFQSRFFSKTKPTFLAECRLLHGAPSGTRTLDPLIKSQRVGE